jgi:hypothetical protein
MQTAASTVGVDVDDRDEELWLADPTPFTQSHRHKVKDYYDRSITDDSNLEDHSS